MRDVCILYVSGDASGGHEKIESTRAGSRPGGRAPERSAVFPSRRRDVTRERDCAECVSVLYLARPACPVRAPLRRRHERYTPHSQKLSAICIYHHETQAPLLLLKKSSHKLSVLAVTQGPSVSSPVGLSLEELYTQRYT